MINYSELTQNVIDGSESPFRGIAVLKDLAKEVAECIKQVEPIAIEEARNYEKNFTQDGFEFEQRNGAVRLDFSNIQEVADLEEQLKAAKAKYKQAYESSKKNLMAVDQDGELLEIPIARFNKDSLIIKRQL